MAIWKRQLGSCGCPDRRKRTRRLGESTAEGVVTIKVDSSRRRAAMVEVNCETDFVAKEAAFRRFVDTVCDRVLAAGPADATELGGIPLDGGGGISIEEERRAIVARIGENVTVRRFATIDSEGGRIGAYVHGMRIGVVVVLEGGDDIVARDIAMHVAASRPVAIRESDMPEGMLESERKILAAQVADSGKRPEIQERMLAGRIAKFLKEVTPARSAVRQGSGSVGARVPGYVRSDGDAIRAVRGR